MSKTSRRKKAERRLGSKMSLYNSMNGKSGVQPGEYSKPGSKQIKG